MKKHSPITNLRHLGRSQATGLEVFSLIVPTPEAIPQFRFLPSPRFTCLLAWNATRASVDQISDGLERLLNLGCLYLCCWGQDCERVHDITDEVVVGDGSVEGPHLMTTWHDEPLSEALDFFLDRAIPDDPQCTSALVLIVASP